MRIPNGINLHRRIARCVMVCAVVLAGCEKNHGEHAAEQTPQKPALIEQSGDLRALINAELTAGNKRVTIPSGRYRVNAQRGNHLVFRNLSDVEIVAENVEMVLTY